MANVSMVQDKEDIKLLREFPITYDDERLNHLLNEIADTTFDKK